MTKGILRNSAYFPTFSELPDENDIDERFLYEDASGVFCAKKTWCVLAEIVDDSMAGWIRHSVAVKDKSGFVFSVYFYLDDDQGPHVFTEFPNAQSVTGRWSRLRKGSTICVRYAEQHQFRDMQEGLRIESLDFVKVIPISLEELLSLSDDKPEARINATTKTCWNCNKPAASKCSRCKMAFYCNKECQKVDWINKHKKICPILPDYMDLVGVNFKQKLSRSVGHHYKTFNIRF